MRWAEFLDWNRKRREYRQAELLERCVVYPPPRTKREAVQRRLNREQVEGFLAKCQSDYLSGWKP